MQSWKQPVDCTTFETRTQSGGSEPNENLIPEKVYYMRMCVVPMEDKTRLYYLRLGGPFQPNEKDVSRFLDSFQIR
jgi:hypothetical protein